MIDTCLKYYFCLRIPEKNGIKSVIKDDDPLSPMMEIFMLKIFGIKNRFI